LTRSGVSATRFAETTITIDFFGRRVQKDIQALKRELLAPLLHAQWAILTQFVALPMAWHGG
jgi:hypothetical protein